MIPFLNCMMAPSVYKMWSFALTLAMCSRVQSPLPVPLSWFVSTQRKPEEESPVKDTDAKQAKQETTVNGSSDSSASNGNGVQEGKSQEASDRLLPSVLTHRRKAL